jgi:hypothetical protein
VPVRLAFKEFPSARGETEEEWKLRMGASRGGLLRFPCGSSEAPPAFSRGEKNAQSKVYHKKTNRRGLILGSRS